MRTPRPPGATSVIKAVCWETETVAKVFAVHECSLLQSGSIGTKSFLSCLVQRSQVVTPTMEVAAIAAPPFWTLQLSQRAGAGRR